MIGKPAPHQLLNDITDRHSFDKMGANRLIRSKRSQIAHSSQSD